MNKCFIIGNLTRDPETRTVQSGATVCTFTVAVNDPFKKDSAEFFRVSAWRQLGENCQKYLAKGRKVAVVGAVGLNTYTKQDGSGGASLEVNADSVEFLGGKNEDGYVEVKGEELPF